MPSHSTKSGIHAIDGMLRRLCRKGSRSRRQSAEYPVSAPSTVATAMPRRKPRATRMSVISIWPQSSPERQSIRMDLSTAEGAGRRLGGATPKRESPSQSAKSSAGSTSPIAPVRARRRGMRLFLRLLALRHAQDVLRIDELIGGLADIGIGGDDAALFQHIARGDDRLALLGADDAAREIVALERLSGDGIGDLRAFSDDGAQLVRMRQGPFARGLIDREHALDEVGMVLGEILAHIEEAIGVEIGIAEEEARALLELGLRHVRIEPGPGIDIAAFERDAAVGMLQQHHLDVLGLKPME